ncbi:MAG: hypothetical protein WBX01_06410 [Nitrososphaeraceae archaeon]
MGSNFIKYFKLSSGMSDFGRKKFDWPPQAATVEIVQEYWKWLCNLPKASNPAIDNDGDRDTEANKLNPKGKEYVFLSFALDGGKNRICTIPEGKKVLIPSLSCIASTPDVENPELNDEQLRRLANTDQENIEYRRIEIDGKPLVGDLEKDYRVKAPRNGVFVVNYAERAVFNAPKGPSRAVADGVYLVWKPSKGDHIVHFEGKIDVPEEEDSLEFRDYIEDVTYTLKVR